jgi:hypothetical protein
MWSDAQAGSGDYKAIFLPWFWHEEYARAVPPGFTLTTEDEDYRRAYGLSLEQMAWRRWKQEELKSDLLFRQEFPATASEAFQLSGHDSFIPPMLVLKARKTQVHSTSVTAPLIIGYDPAWTGGDRHSMALRRGRRVLEVRSRVGLTVTESAGWLGHVIRVEKPAQVFIDVGGVGAGVYDILCEQGFGYIVSPVNFGSPPLLSMGNSGGPANRRAEVWQASKDWLEQPAGVSIPDSDEIQADATAPGYRYNSASRLLIESKEHIRRRGLPSPDTWDAIALSFAEPVIDAHWTQRPRRDLRYIV